MSNQGTKYIRTPQGSHEEWLVRIGWEMVGLNLWEYPNSFEFRLYYTTDQAIAISEENGLDLYCPACGACGTDGCCSPTKCKCLHHGQYKQDYETLLRENESFYTFIQGVADTIYLSVDELSNEAKKVLSTHPDAVVSNVSDKDSTYPVHTDDRLGRNPLK